MLFKYLNPISLANLFTFSFGGGGGGGQQSAPSSQQTTVNPVADWALPTASALIGSQMSNAYNIGPGGEILGSKGFTPFGGATNAQGNFTGAPISQDQYNQQLGVAGLGVAGPSGLQQQSYQAGQNLQMPGQYGMATNLTNQAAMGSLGAADQSGGLQNQALGYGAAGAQYGGAGAQYGSAGAQQAQQAAALTAAQAGMYGAQGSQAGQQGAAQSSLYGGLGSQAGQTAAGQSGLYGGLGALSGQQYAGQSSGYGGMGAGYGAQGAQIGQSLGQQSQDPNAVQNYMNPYLQASLNPQLAEIQRQYDVTGTQQQSGATKSGAFGGSREALMAAENQRNAGLAKNQAIGQGYNQAFQNAQQQMQAANQAALSGNAQAMQGAGIGLQGAGQAGSQALAGYGMGLQGAGQAGTQAMQGYGMGLTGAGQAGQLGLQGAQAGLAGVGAQQTAANLGLAGTAQGMQGAGLGMQGAQAGQQGVQGAIGAGQYGLQGLGQAGALGSQLANIGTQQLGAQQGVINTQNTLGTQQQQNQQNLINQAIQNYGNQQQYGTTQATNIMNLLRATPTTSQQTTYQAAPSPISQLGGLGATALGAYGAYGGFKAKGGVIKEKKMAKGGIAKYDVGGSVESSLSEMPSDKLAEIARSSESPFIREKASEILAERNAGTAVSKQLGSAGITGAGSSSMANMAGGGIVAFVDGGLSEEEMRAGSNPNQAELNQFYAGATDSEGNPIAAPALSGPKGSANKLSPYYADYAALTGDRKDVGANYLAALKAAQPDAKQQMWGRLMELGANTAAGTSANPFTNLAQGAAKTVPGFMEDIKERRKGEIEQAKAAFDISNVEYADKVKLLTLAQTDKNAFDKIASDQGISAATLKNNLQIAIARDETAIKTAGISAEAHKETAKNSAAATVEAARIRAAVDREGPLFAKIADSQTKSLFAQKAKELNTTIDGLPDDVKDDLIMRGIENARRIMGAASNYKSNKDGKSKPVIKLD